MLKDKKFLVHLQFGDDASFGETVVPIFAASLDEAHEWADATYGSQGIEVTRIRPDVKQPTKE